MNKLEGPIHHRLIELEKALFDLVESTEFNNLKEYWAACDAMVDAFNVLLWASTNKIL